MNSMTWNYPCVSLGKADGTLTKGVSVSGNYRRGIGVAQAVKCLFASDNDLESAEKLAVRVYGQMSEAACVLKSFAATKAAVSPFKTTDANRGAAIADGALAEFWEMVEESTIPFRLNARRVPPGAKIGRLTGAGSAYWVTQGLHVPVTSMVTSNLNEFEFFKIAAVAVFTTELLDFSNTAADELIRRELLRVTREGIDGAFIDPANAGSSNKPASVTNGVTPLPASGDTQALLAYDLREQQLDFGGNLETSFYVCHPALAAALNSFEHSDIGPRGGTLVGIPVLTSRSVPTPVSGHILVLVDGDRIAVADGATDINTSNAGSVAMADNASGATANQVSLWQSDLVAIKVSREINWEAEAPAVSVIEDIQIREVSA